MTFRISRINDLGVFAIRPAKCLQFVSCMRCTLSGICELIHSPDYSGIIGKERHKGFPVIITRTPFTRKQRLPQLFWNPLIFTFIRIIGKTGIPDDDNN